MNKQLKVAIVGCGQIADAHLQELRKLKSARVVAVCDRHLDLARQAGQRFGVEGIYDDLARLLHDAKPDVVHITTPPQTHAPLANQAILGGAHVYLEKPFALNLAEADTVLSLADAHDRLVCVGHDQLFDPVWLDLRRMLAAGQLGEVVHIDSVMGYDIAGPFGRLMLSDHKHWVHRLPGGLIQNNLSHAIYKVTDLVEGAPLSISAVWRCERGNTPTELRALLQWEKASATILFSSGIRPIQRIARVHGTRGAVEVDFEARVIRAYRAARLPGPFAKIDAPWRQAWEASGSFLRNLYKFCRADLQYFAGMNRLFTLFYQAILESQPSPISPDEIRRVTYLMDEMFSRCRASETACAASEPATP